jgi:hypothetical protein
MGWGRLAEVRVEEVSGSHGAILQEPHVQALAQRLRPYLAWPNGEPAAALDLPTESRP